MDLIQIITTSGAIGALGLAVTAYIRTRPAMKTAEVQGEAALWAEIHKLKQEQTLEREECRHRIATLEATVADLQHDLASEAANFDAFLLLAEVNPEKVIEQIPRIREERLRHKERMAMKRGVREGLAIKGADE